MRRLQEFRVTLDRGKVKTKDQVGNVKKVVDSASEYLLQQTEISLHRETEISKNPKTAIRILNIWEDLGEIEREPKKATKKKEPKK